MFGSVWGGVFWVFGGMSCVFLDLIDLLCGVEIEDFFSFVG